ncbi:MAG: hypothetical protein R3360_02795 [Alphaproteobacteria bacterium]|nr:hypothetical protein [Alphaproteobacteria bacterium]
MRAVLTVFAFLLIFAVVSPVLAEEGAEKSSDPSLSDKWDEMSEEMKQQMQDLLDAMGGFVKSIPQYEAPVVLDNGDILIRRKNPDGAPREEDPPCVCHT